MSAATAAPVLKNKTFTGVQSRGVRRFEIFRAPRIPSPLSPSPPPSFSPLFFVFAEPSASWARSSTRKIPNRKRAARAISTFCASRLSSRCFNIPLTQRRGRIRAWKYQYGRGGGGKRTHGYAYLEKREKWKRKKIEWASGEPEGRTYVRAACQWARTKRIRRFLAIKM